MSLVPRPVPLTAILSCRNAALTLARCLDHLIWHGSRVVAVDDGSTDSTRDILESYHSKGQVDLMQEEYGGVFDLTAQLRRKVTIMEDITSGWIIHADADEFVDSPDGSPLAEYLRLWDTSPVVAFPCAERMYLPRFEEDVHAPSTYPETMLHYARMTERNQKQRVFRAGAPLRLWLASGGHSITRTAGELAPVELTLRHYFGLSLDHIRSRSLGRSFSPRDTAKGWHGNRVADRSRVVPPSPEVMYEPEATPVFEPPVFSGIEIREREPDAASDLIVLCLADKAAYEILAVLSTAFPELRIVRAGPEFDLSSGAPVLSVISHPATLCATIGDASDAAETWLRFASVATQTRLAARRGCTVLRAEDLGEGEDAVVSAARSLLLGEPQTRLPAADLPRVVRSDYEGRLKAITASLALDFGYA